MIKQIQGNLLDYDGILVHQVNTLGVMGAGVALQIRNNLMTEEQFWEYQNRCIEHKSALLGTVLFQKCGDKVVANCFAQDRIQGAGVRTHYGALGHALREVKEVARKNGLPVYIPGYIGCGLAGGNWAQVVYPLIHTVFQDCERPYDITIVYFKPSMILEELDKAHDSFDDVIAVPFLQFPSGNRVKDIKHWYDTTFGGRV